MYLYYGNGNCTIDEGLSILSIYYRGVIKIIDKTNDNNAIIVKNQKIIIFPVRKSSTFSELFHYEGEFKILRAIGTDINGNQIYVKIKKFMDYAETMNSKSEDLTINSENLNSGYIYKNIVTKNTVDKKTINNQLSQGTLYLKDGSPYFGAYHIHIDSNKSMTGRTHTKDSQNLYMLKLTGELVLTGG